MKTRPIVPEDRITHARRAASIIPRAAFASYVAAARGGRTRDAAAETAHRLWPRDDAPARLFEVPLTRTDATVATTTGSGWADDLAADAMRGFLASLTPGSAAASLMARGITVPIPQGHALFNVPGRATGPVAAPWATEGAPIVVRDGAFTSVEMKPGKIAVIATLTRELARVNAGAAEPIFRQLVIEDAIAGIDSAHSARTRRGPTTRPDCFTPPQRSPAVATRVPILPLSRSRYPLGGRGRLPLSPAPVSPLRSRQVIPNSRGRCSRRSHWMTIRLSASIPRASCGASARRILARRKRLCSTWPIRRLRLSQQGRPPRIP